MRLGATSSKNQHHISFSFVLFVFLLEVKNVSVKIPNRPTRETRLSFFFFITALLKRFDSNRLDRDVSLPLSPRLSRG